MSYVTLVKPGDRWAQEWFDKYEQYKQLRRVSSMKARMRTVRDEPEVWATGSFSLGFLCAANSLPVWVDGIIAFVGAWYWVWFWNRAPRAQQSYRRCLADGRIMRVPEFLYNACNRAAKAEGNLTDWHEYPARRFQLLADVLKEAAPWLTELENDCGCTKVCGHTNRLVRSKRRALRRRVRTAAERKVRLMRQDHLAALEANQLRNRTIAGMLEATSEEDD